MHEFSSEEEMKLQTVLPYFFRGRVVSGFGRGGKQLNCPTANLDETTVAALPPQLTAGVFYGMSRIIDPKFDNHKPHNMVMSIGLNPQFDGKQKTMEVHILHSFDEDFYGSQIEGLICGFIRQMKSFGSLEDLISAIEADKRVAEHVMSSRNDRDELVKRYFDTAAKL